MTESENESGEEDPSENLNKRGFPARKRKAKTFGIDDVITIPEKKQQPAVSGCCQLGHGS